MISFTEINSYELISIDNIIKLQKYQNKVTSRCWIEKSHKKKDPWFKTKKRAKTCIVRQVYIYISFLELQETFETSHFYFHDDILLAARLVKNVNIYLKKILTPTLLSKLGKVICYNPSRKYDGNI